MSRKSIIEKAFEAGIKAEVRRRLGLQSLESSFQEFKKREEIEEEVKK